MNVNNIVSKITKNIDNIGIAGGALAFGWNKLVENVERLPSEGHIPDVSQTLKEFFRGEMKEHVKSAIMFYLGGYAADVFGFKKEGNLIKKFSVGYVKGLALQHVLYYSTHATGDSFPDGSLRKERAMYERVVGGIRGDPYAQELFIR